MTRLSGKAATSLLFTGSMWKGFAKANDAIADMLTKTASSKLGLGSGNLSGIIKNNMNKIFSEIDWTAQPLKMYADGRLVRFGIEGSIHKGIGVYPNEELTIRTAQ